MSSSKKRKRLLSQLEQYMEYDEYVSLCKEKQPVNYKLFPGVMPMWDNSSRRKDNYFVFKNSTPEKYPEWLENEVNSFHAFGNDENFLFINAWNEWAEGNHLESCRKWGKRYLEATKNAINS